MIRFKNELKDIPFNSLKQIYPYVQERVYDALLNLTPGQLQFELNLLTNNHFCNQGIDQSTFEIIGTIMSIILNEKNLILTRDDIIVCFLRFKELMFLYEAIRQNILKPKITDMTIEYYYPFHTTSESTENVVKYKADKIK